MSKHEYPASTQEKKRAIREQLQWERLRLLLTSDVLDRVKKIPYGDRCALERMTEIEGERLVGWNDALPIPTTDVSLLSQLLNAKTPNIEQLKKVCAEYGLEQHMGLLLHLFSEGKRVGVVELMSERGKTKRKHSSRRNVEMGLRWLRLEHEDPGRYGAKKKSVAAKLAEEFNLEFDYVYRELMRGSRQDNTTLFPDGVEAARLAAGLEPGY